MVSLTIYIASFAAIIAIVGAVTTFFNSNIRDLRGSVSSSSEYNKFNVYMLEYTKNGYEIQRCDKIDDDQFITFSKDGKTDTFVKLGNILYFNNIKLCENVEDFKLERKTASNGKEKLETYLQINGVVYTTDYVIE